MNLRSSLYVPTALALLLLTIGCSGESTSPGTGGTASGGSGGGAAGSVATGGSGAGGAAGASTGGGGFGGFGGVAVGGGGGGSGGSVGGGGASAGSGTGGSAGGENYRPTLQTFRDFVFPQCTGGLCHDLGPEHPFYFKNDSTLYTALTTHFSMNCNMPVITKGDPANSALIKLLKEPCGQTPRMPLDKCFDTDPQDSEYCVKPPLLAALEEWIRRGAPEND